MKTMDEIRQMLALEIDQRRVLRDVEWDSKGDTDAYEVFVNEIEQLDDAILKLVPEMKDKPE